MRLTVGLLPLASAFGSVLAGDGLIKLIGNAAAAEPKEVISAQIRKQGFACDRPVSAEPDRERSKANETVWLLNCGNATYRVRLIPRRAAGVERIE